jgi:hypothetical protein
LLFISVVTNRKFPFNSFGCDRECDMIVIFSLAARDRHHHLTSRAEGRGSVISLQETADSVRNKPCRLGFLMSNVTIVSESSNHSQST